MSFLILPPEIRMIIYNILLQSCLASNTRILYSGTNPLRCGDTPPSIRHQQSYHVDPQDRIYFLSSRILYSIDIRKATYKIHHSNLDDLLSISATCRLIRSESLALIWSNADIHVKSPEFSNELTWILCNRLSWEACNSITTLHIHINQKTRSPSHKEITKSAGFLICQLPQLKLLVVEMRISYSPKKDLPIPELLALRILPMRVTVKVHHYVSDWFLKRFLNANRFQQVKNVREASNMWAEKVLLAARENVDLVHRKRRGERDEKAKRDEVGEVLEDTLEMRSDMLG
ncbi:hypothetical protein D6D01_06241 [Aureobasidium pullulans]|uniref:F-box domain-containing protein n=1 Tax=Aureobasidium pullulans TaxID=5580 RepID=A0A4S9L2E7_AURPU|nr:hypothetical protein D6D01_06241 [Aureobasidium pullulans]